MGLFSWRSAPTAVATVKSVAELTVANVDFKVKVTAGAKDAMNSVRSYAWEVLKAEYKNTTGTPKERVEKITAKLNNASTQLYRDIDSRYQPFVLSLGNESIIYPKEKGWEALVRPQLKDVDTAAMLQVLADPSKAISAKQVS